MNLSCIKAIVWKDGLAAVRNKLVLLGLVWGVLIAGVYYALPSSVDETFALGVYDRGSSQLFSQMSGLKGEGIEITSFSSEEALKKALEKESYIAGIVLPENFDAQLRSEETPTLKMYFMSETPESARSSIEHSLQMAIEYLALGKIPMQIHTEILGKDMAGARIPLRERSLPLYLVMALVVEMWTIGTLVVEESAAGTLRAVLVTPASPSDVITAKGVVGISYSLTVAVAILALTWSFRGNLPVLFLGVLLGALMAVALGLFLGSLTENITGSFIYIAVPMLIFLLPGVLIFIPDLSLSVVKVIPTYYLVNAFDQILNYGAGLTEVWKDFLIIVGCDVVFFGMGVYALRRRY